MKKIISILTFSLAFLAFSFGQSDADYLTTLKKMFKVSGAEESYQSALKQMVVMFKQQSPDVELSVWEEFEKEFSNTSINEIVELLVPVYKKYMTQEGLWKK